MARDTWLSRMESKVKDSQLSAMSSRTLALPLMTTSSKGFFVCGMVLTGILSVKVADGGDMVLRYLDGLVRRG